MPRIFDCFIFFNELDLLEIRLNELDPVVDRFVLCESTVTFRGEPKPLHFLANRRRFRSFLSKILHVVVEDMPRSAGGSEYWRKYTKQHWKREKFQRNAIRRGLSEARSEDFVILSDLDEIPRASVVAALARVAEPQVFSLQMNSFRYFVNLREAQLWDKGRMARLGDIRTMQALRGGGPTWQANSSRLPARLRQLKRMTFGMRHIRPWSLVPDAGWHFTFMNGPGAMVTKPNSYSQVLSEPPTEAAMAASIEHALREAARPFTGQNGRLAALDASYPRWLVDNRARFAGLLLDPGVLERFR
jgi:beta-1,4-mannosyl-glycoprotein beta-1,4-N-acetylglucosaminyltransferase